MARMTQATPNDYWISPTALYLEMNALGNPDYLQVSCMSGAQILVYVKGVIGYDAGHNYQRWPLQGLPTALNTHTRKYVYAAIPKPESEQRVAMLVFPSEVIDIYGKNAEGEQVGRTDCFYIFLQGILTDSGENGSIPRNWLSDDQGEHRIVTGFLSSDEALDGGPSTTDWYNYSEVDGLVTFLKDLTMQPGTKFRDLPVKLLQVLTGGKIAFADSEGMLRGMAGNATPLSSDDTAVTPKYLDDHALSKQHNDHTDHQLSARDLKATERLTVGTYYSGMSGAGFDERGNGEVESLKVRSYLEVIELIINRLAAIEGDQILTEADTIESVDDLGNNCYGLHLRSKWEGYFTAQVVGNVLKGIINTLAEGNGKFYTAWMRVNSVNTANNYIEVVMYPDEEVPAGRNFAPCAMMKVARWGNQTDPKRQSCLYLSSTEGRIVKLTGVTKPILEPANFGATFGSLPDFVKSMTDSQGNPLPIREGLDYMYIPGIVAMDIITLDKWTMKPISAIVDRGIWRKGGKYYCEAVNPDSGKYETSDVWHMGCKYRCCKNLTAVAPAWNTTDWIMIEGNPEFTVRFAEEESLIDPDRIDIPLTVVATLYNQDVTADILDADVQWTRYSEDADGVPRVESDNVWALRHANSGKSIRLTRDDMDFTGYMPQVLRFTATVTLRDGMGNEAERASANYEY